MMLRIYFLLLFCGLFLTGCGLPDQSALGVLTTATPLRYAPALSDDNLVVYLQPRDTVSVLTIHRVADEGGKQLLWYRVSHPAGGYGWLQGRYVRLLDEGGPAAAILTAPALPPPPLLARPDTNLLPRRAGPENLIGALGDLATDLLGTRQDVTLRTLTRTTRNNSVVRRTAATLAAAHPGSFNLAQVVDIYEEIDRRWQYVNDQPARDYWAPAAETIELGYIGDCEDRAIVTAAMLMAVGGGVTVVTAQSEAGGHAYAEVLLGDGSHRTPAIDYLQARYPGARFPGLRLDHRGRLWLNLDGGDHPGDTYFDYQTATRYDLLGQTYANDRR